MHLSALGIGSRLLLGMLSAIRAIVTSSNTVKDDASRDASSCTAGGLSHS